MDLGLLRILQSIAKVEEDSRFKSKKYVIVDEAGRDGEGRRVAEASGLIPVRLKHPDAVIVVASPTGKAPPQAVGEVRVPLLSMAIHMASVLSKRGIQGCSIIIHEGLYIDPTFHGVIAHNWRPGFSLEIIGTNQVRILNTSPIESLFQVDKGELTLKNISLYGHGSVPLTRLELEGSCDELTTIGVIGSKLLMVDIRIYSRGCQNAVLDCLEGSELRAIDCVFSQFRSPFTIQQSKAEFKNCQWLFAIDNERSEQGDRRVMYTNVGLGGSATILQCQFVVNRETDFEMDRAAVEVTDGGEIVMTDSSVSGFEFPIVVRSSSSKGVVNRCQLLDCYIAILSEFNSDVVVTDSCLAADCVLGLRFNEKGKVQFLRNTVKPRQLLNSRAQVISLDNTQAGAQAGALSTTARIIIDRWPKVLKHDFKSIEFLIEEEPQEWYDPCIGATQKSRRKLMKWHQDSGIPPARQFCLLCKKFADDQPEEKFKYCGKCRKVGYCSKACQRAHWMDHKMVCKD